MGEHIRAHGTALLEDLKRWLDGQGHAAPETNLTTRLRETAKGIGLMVSLYGTQLELEVNNLAPGCKILASGNPVAFLWAKRDDARRADCWGALMERDGGAVWVMHQLPMSLPRWGCALVQEYRPGKRHPAWEKLFVNFAQYAGTTERMRRARGEMRA